jgi:hypothetical protein
MIAVRFDFCAVQWARRYSKRVLFFGYQSTTLPQLRMERADTLAFLDAETPKVDKSLWRTSKRRQHNRRHNAVPKVSATRETFRERLD